MEIQTTEDLVMKRSAETGDGSTSRNGYRSKRPKPWVVNYRGCSDEDGDNKIGERPQVLHLMKPIRIPDSAGSTSYIPGRKDVPKEVCSGRQNFARFKGNMKHLLLKQVATGNPEVSGDSAKGWDFIVDYLMKRGGPEWAQFNVRVARENTRKWVTAWENKTGTGENATDDEKLCRTISKMWMNKSKEQPVKPKTKKQLGEALGKTSNQQRGGGRDDVDDMETTTDEGITPSGGRKTVTDALECLKEAKEKEVGQTQEKLDLKKKALELEERRLIFQEDQARVAQKLQQSQLEMFQKSQEIQAGQIQTLLSLHSDLQSKLLYALTPNGHLLGRGGTQLDTVGTAKPIPSICHC